MSIQRFQRSGPPAHMLDLYTENGGAPVGFGPQYIDINLANDADLADLQACMTDLGFAYVSQAPLGPPATQIGPSARINPAGYISGFGIARNGSTPASQLDIFAGTARDDADFFDLTSAATLTADITQSGANGLDTGMEAASMWYSAWVIGDPTGTNPIASLLSLSATNPTMPAGYTSKRRVGWVRNDAASNFLDFTQTIAEGRARQIQYPDLEQATTNVLTAGAAVGFTNVALGALVPPTSRLAMLVVQHEGAVGINDHARIRPGGSAVTNPATRSFAGLSLVGAADASSAWFQRTDGSQQVEYRNNTAGGSTDIWAVGYVDEL